MENFDVRESLILAEQMAQLYLVNPKKRDYSHPLTEHCGTEDSKDPNSYEPPKQLLMYLARMGSFTSRPKFEAKDSDDETYAIPPGLEYGDFLNWIKQQQPRPCPVIPRLYKSAPGRGGACQESTPFRVLQWNILAQALGREIDNFVRCPKEALEWENRRFRILEEILIYDPDIICLQEVDHFNFLQRMLDTQGFNGYFVPKPDSPCIYLRENNGPDGCAIFYKRERFAFMTVHSKVLEVWKVQSNQVVILSIFQDLITGNEVTILTTHLKARKGALLATFRCEQGGDLLAFLSKHKYNRPSIICGDFNAEPTEPVYSRILQNEHKLSSAYAIANEGTEPPYSTWKIRGDGEVKHNLDYIFYTADRLILEGCVDAPVEKDIGVNRVPSYIYPSDHFSLVSDFSFNSKNVRQDVKLKSRQ